jgi:hypothetical protein
VAVRLSRPVKAKVAKTGHSSQFGLRVFHAENGQFLTFVGKNRVSIYRCVVRDSVSVDLVE